MVHSYSDQSGARWLGFASSLASLSVTAHKVGCSSAGVGTTTALEAVACTVVYAVAAEYSLGERYFNSSDNNSCQRRSIAFAALP